MDKSLILSSLQNHYNFKKDASFAKFLGISGQVLSKWKSRNTFDVDILYTKCVGVNAEYLLTGEGEMLKRCEESTVAQVDYKELAEARLEIIEFLKEKIEKLETEVTELKYISKEPILYKDVAEPTPELKSKKTPK